MGSMANITVIGNAGRKPEVRETTNGTKVCDFSIAVNHKIKDSEQTDWYRCVVWGKRAENAAQLIDKGALVSVTGSLRMDSYKANDGTTKSTMEINASDFQILSSKGGGSVPTDSGDSGKKADAPF